MKTYIKPYIWFIPFLFFLVGYYGVAFLVRHEACKTPLLVGLPLQEAVVQLSDTCLNVRILAQKDDPDVEQGTVVRQIPAAGQKIRSNQSVFLVVTRKPKKKKVPDLVGLSAHEACNALDKEVMRYKVFPLCSLQVQGTILAQSPSAGSDFDGAVLLYVSAGSDDMYWLVPDLRGHQLDEAREYMRGHGIAISATCTYKDLEESQMRITNQKPLAGSLVRLAALPCMYVSCSRF